MTLTSTAIMAATSRRWMSQAIPLTVTWVINPNSHRITRIATMVQNIWFSLPGCSGPLATYTNLTSNIFPGKKFEPGGPSHSESSPGFSARWVHRQRCQCAYSIFFEPALGSLYIRWLTIPGLEFGSTCPSWRSKRYARAKHFLIIKVFPIVRWIRKKLKKRVDLDLATVANNNC